LKVKVLFFAALREQLGAPAMDLDPADPLRGVRCHHPLVAWT